MNFAIIVAVDKNFGIGKNGGLPWDLPGEIRHFKEVTTKAYSEFPNVVIMGRKTWESIPLKFRPLVNRINVVLTRVSGSVFPSNVFACSSLDEALRRLKSGDFNGEVGKVFVIGGAELFKTAIAHPSCHEIYLTKIDKFFSCDTYFPKIDESFRLSFQSTNQVESEVSYHFEIYQR